MLVASGGLGVLELPGALGLGCDHQFVKSRAQSSPQADLGCESHYWSFLTISFPQPAGKRCQTSPSACAVQLSVHTLAENAFWRCNLALSSAPGQPRNPPVLSVREEHHAHFSWKCSSRAHLPTEARGERLIPCAGQMETQGLPTQGLPDVLWLLGVRKPVLCKIFTLVEWNYDLKPVRCAVIRL